MRCPRKYVCVTVHEDGALCGIRLRLRRERKMMIIWNGASWWRLAFRFEGQAILYKWQETIYISQSGGVNESVG